MNNALSADSVPALFKNLKNGELKQFFINPSELDVALKAKYKVRDVLGVGNNESDYEKTDNMEIKFSLYIHAFHIQHEGRVSRERARLELTDWRAFLTSFLLPIGNEKKGWVGGGDPPRVWFSWPNVLSMNGKITSVGWKLKQFELSGHSVYEVAKIGFLADWGSAMWSDEIRLTGWEIN